MDSAHRLPRRSSISSTTTINKRSSVGSIFAKLGLRSSSPKSSTPVVPTQHHPTSIPSTVYEDEDEAMKPPQISEDFKRYELLTEL